MPGSRALGTRAAAHRARQRDDAGSAARLLDPVAAWYVGNILIGAPPPDNAPPGRIAFKTGTSYGYRDAWAVGFDGRMTIGVWVGRPDGAPVPGLVGRAAAAPILFDAFARSGNAPAPLTRAPKGAVFAATANLPPPLQRFMSGGRRRRAEPPRIMFPPDGARLELARRRQAGAARAQDRRRRGAAHRHGQWCAAAAQGGRRTVSSRRTGPASRG